uniref:PS II complex 12 kDa extrinsic protein n=1 Tax=Fibrocapsa japonica TaxID=94617 RepID=A0A7S2UVN9_9STRA|mmetsp:Transcript_15730/g.23126  ORF Transcript_15730/g.23126 Transcript_15730/m.23126 type:complete len:129 (+) Transcript_15730:171-557(+)
MKIAIAVVAVAALSGVSAFNGGVVMGRASSALKMSRFDGQVWGTPQMKEIYDEWNPDLPRSEDNFNPFERNKDGNQCDTSGYFPGDTKYKDPARPDTDFAAMMADRAVMDQLKTEEKFNLKGKPGCYN